MLHKSQSHDPMYKNVLQCPSANHGGVTPIPMCDLNHVADDAVLLRAALSENRQRYYVNLHPSPLPIAVAGEPLIKAVYSLLDVLEFKTKHDNGNRCESLWITTYPGSCISGHEGVLDAYSSTLLNTEEGEFEKLVSFARIWEVAGALRSFGGRVEVPHCNGSTNNEFHIVLGLPLASPIAPLP